MNEPQAFDAYHKAFVPADERPGIVFVARWWQGPTMGFQESEPFANRQEALRYADRVRRIYTHIHTGAVVVALSGGAQ